MRNLPARYKVCGSPLRGGFGEVYICNDLQLERRVAIKFIQDVNQKSRLRDEFVALMRIRSKHVVQLYDVILADNDTYGLVQEYVEGEDLLESDYPRRSELNYLKTVWQIAAGIADIHVTGIIHRDIKPNNMKTSAEGVVKIFDFGLSRHGGLNSQTKGFKGTVGFAAPELCGGGDCSFTQAVDTFAFGATALYLAIGPSITSFESSQFATLAIIPPAIRPVLEACMSCDPAARPQMKDMRNLIAPYLLRDTHQALAVIGGKKYVLNTQNRNITLEMGAVGKVKITYNGLGFVVSHVEGAVYINNAAVVINQVMPGSCVITLGNNGTSRDFVPFDVSNPEVVL